MTAFSSDTFYIPQDKEMLLNSVITEDLEEIKRIFVHNFVLAQDLNPGNYRIPINAESIKLFKSKSQNFMILDIKCNASDALKIADKFAKYKHLFMESNQGMRGIIFFKSLKWKHQRHTFNKIQNEIKEFGELNPFALSLFGRFAPLPKNIVISENKNGSHYETSNKFETEPLKRYKLESTNFLDACLEYFTKDGFVRNLDIPESSGYRTYIKGNESYKWNEKYPWMMFHRDPLQTKNIYKLVSSLRIKERLKQLEYAPDIVVHSQSLELKDFRDACDAFIKKGGVLAIKSYMGSSKSDALGYAIEQSKKLKKKILVITSRITLAQEFKQKFNLPLYSDFKGKTIKFKGSIICQYDSLSRIDPRNYDVVIVDEFCSVVFHSVDNLIEDKRSVLRKFLGLLKKDVVIADAFLNTEFLRLLRRPVKTLTNTQKDTIPLFECTKEGLFEEMQKCLSKREQVSVSTNSVKAIESTIARICSLLEKTSTVVIGPKSHEYKVQKIETLNRKKYKDDIIIYSPALSLGVSIFNKIKNHFHFDSGLSANAIQSIQMLRRARKADKIFYYIGEATNYGPQDFEAYKQFAYDKMDSNNSWMFDIDGNLSDIGIYCAQVGVIKNILSSNTAIAFNKLLHYNFENIKHLQ